MHLMRESWTDERLDDLNEKVDRGFAKIDERFVKIDERFVRIDERFERLEGKIDAKFEGLYRLLVQCMLGMMAIMIGGFATLLAAVIWV